MPVSELERLLALARKGGAKDLALFAMACITYYATARRELMRCLSYDTPTNRHRAVGSSLTTSRLLTIAEAAAIAGPSFTAKKLYRLRPSMPLGCCVRKGGRLYIIEEGLRRWLVDR